MSDMTDGETGGTVWGKPVDSRLKMSGMTEGGIVWH